MFGADVEIHFVEQIGGNISAVSAEIDEHFFEKLFVFSADHIQRQIGVRAEFVGDEQISEFVAFLRGQRDKERVVRVLRVDISRRLVLRLRLRLLLVTVEIRLRCGRRGRLICEIGRAHV